MMCCPGLRFRKAPNRCQAPPPADKPSSRLSSNNCLSPIISLSSTISTLRTSIRHQIEMADMDTYGDDQRGYEGNYYHSSTRRAAYYDQSEGEVIHQSITMTNRLCVSSTMLLTSRSHR